MHLRASCAVIRPRSHGVTVGAETVRRARLRRARRPLALSAFLLLTASMAAATEACGRRTPATADVSLTLTPATPVVGPATLSVTVRSREAGGQPARVTGAAVRLEGHMTHAGMAPVLASATERAPGTYEIPFTFTMPGDWALLVAMEWPDGTRVERRLDVADVRPAR